MATAASALTQVYERSVAGRVAWVGLTYTLQQALSGLALRRSIAARM